MVVAQNAIFLVGRKKVNKTIASEWLVEVLFGIGVVDHEIKTVGEAKGKHEQESQVVIRDVVYGPSLRGLESRGQEEAAAQRSSLIQN